MFKAQYLEKLRNGQLPNERANWTLVQALDSELEIRAATHRRTSAAPNQTVRNNLIRVLGAETKLKRLASINKIEGYQLKRLGEGKSAKTVNNEVSFFAVVLQKGGLWDVVAPKYKPLPVEHRGPGRALTPQEGERLFDVAQRKAGRANAFAIRSRNGNR